MVLLLTSRRVLSWLCVCPPDVPISKLSVFITVVAISANAIGGIVSVVYFFKFVSIDLSSSLSAVLQICANINLEYATVLIFLLRHKVIALLSNLSVIYKKHEDDDSFRYLVQANNKSEWLWKIYFRLMIGFFISNVINGGTSLLSWYRNDEFNTDELYRPYKFSFPWNQYTKSGYIAEIGSSIIIGEAYILVNGTLLLIFISICWHHQAFYKMHQLSLRKLDRPDKDRNDKGLLCNLICFHIQVKDWFMASAHIFNLYILIQLISSMAVLATAVYQLDMQIKHTESNISNVITSILIGLLNLFLYYYYGKLATDSFSKMTANLYDSNWPELTFELQKYFILMIENSQRPLQYTGFGLSILNLETFSAMLKTVYTFYMVFKTAASD